MDSTALNKAYKDFLALPEVGWPTVVSAFLHIAVFIFAVFGIPQIADKSDIYLAPDEMVMSVELFNTSEVLEEDQPPKEGGDTPPPPSKPIYNNTDSVPMLAEPEQPDIKEDKPAPSKEVVVPDPTLIKVPPKPKSKPKPPIPPEPKPVEAKPVEPKEPDKPERNITNLLKDLTPGDWENAEEQINSNDNSSGRTSQHGNAAVQMTSSDLVALNQGVQQCWNVNAGGRMAENLEVKLHVKVNKDRSVREVNVMDKIRYATDPHFRAAADAAERALLHPDCRTLNLPPEKYETWKSFIYVFDPSQML
jgi:DNA polymerase III gamma/tau subunit